MFESKEPGQGAQDVSTLRPSLVASVSYVTLSQAIGVKVDTLHGWVAQGRIVQPIYFGRLARWSEDQARQILAEGVQPAGTYPPHGSPRAKQLAARPKNATKSLGHQVKTNGPTARKKTTPKKTTPKKRRGK